MTPEAFLNAVSKPGQHTVANFRSFPEPSQSGDSPNLPTELHVSQAGVPLTRFFMILAMR